LFCYEKGAILPLITFAKCFAVEKVIELVRGHALLHDPGHRNYMNAQTKSNVWNSIAHTLDISEADGRGNNFTNCCFVHVLVI
jgi:hypothetical protein